MNDENSQKSSLKRNSSNTKKKVPFVNIDFRVRDENNSHAANVDRSITPNKDLYTYF
jgi:hypothetical protein